MRKVIGKQMFLSAVLGVTLAFTAVFVINPMVDWGTSAGGCSGYRMLLTLTILFGIGILTIYLLNNICKFNKSIDSKWLLWIICLLFTCVVTVAGGYILTVIVNLI